MSLRRIALLAALAAAGCYPEQIDPMKVQPRFRAYAASGFFEDGRAMRPPPAGTVARERRLAGPAVTEGLQAGQPVTTIPVPLTREGLEAGRKRFDISCAVCHGVLGDGKSVVAGKMSLRPPTSLHERKDKPPGHLYRVIALGFGFMPHYADVLSVEERWQVVGYVQALQLSQGQPVQSAPPEEQQRLEKEKP